MSTSKWKGSEETMLPRSRLYSLVPLGLETAWVESLTSYINRLAWAYKVGPQMLVAQEILPNLKGSHYLRSAHDQLSGFCHTGVMGVNGSGELAIDWAATLEGLTMRSDLRHLIIHHWASGLPTIGLLRANPAWCPECYRQWYEQKHPTYQPLLWMLQVVTVCPHHRRWLKDRCPICGKKQTAIAAKTQLGYCTSCASLLGAPALLETEDEIDDETLVWQRWVIHMVEEMHTVGATSGPFLWEQLSVGLSACAEAVGSLRSFAQMVGVPYMSLSNWCKGLCIPAFEKVLKLCYVLDISPLQLLADNPEALVEKMRPKERRQRFHPRGSRSFPVNWERIRQFIQAVLDGREAPLGVTQVARKVNISARYLRKKFPQECALITAQYQMHRAEQAKQRIERESSEVRQIMLTLSEQGTKPRKHLVRALLSDANILRRPECRTTWHDVRRELKLES